MIKQELDRIKERISNKDFLENKGLSNEVGIHVFCYKAEDELIVQDYIRRLKSEVNTPYRIIECDLYEVFLSLLEDKRILKSVAGLEAVSYTHLSAAAAPKKAATIDDALGQIDESFSEMLLRKIKEAQAYRRDRGPGSYLLG